MTCVLLASLSLLLSNNQEAVFSLPEREEYPFRRDPAHLIREILREIILLLVNDASCSFQLRCCCCLASPTSCHLNQRRLAVPSALN